MPPLPLGKIPCSANPPLLPTEIRSYVWCGHTAGSFKSPFSSCWYLYRATQPKDCNGRRLVLCQTKEEFYVSVPSDPLKCAVVFNVLCKRYRCVAEIYPVWPMWSRDMTPPPRAPAPLPYLPGHWRLSLLVTLNKDGSGQCSGHPWTAQSTICGPCRMYVNIVLYFSSSNIVFWSVLPNGYLHSTDCCIFL